MLKLSALKMMKCADYCTETGRRRDTQIRGRVQCRHVTSKGHPAPDMESRNSQRRVALEEIERSTRSILITVG